MTNEVLQVYFKWVLARTDPSAYKKYAPELEPVGLYVGVNIPISEIIYHNSSEDRATITPRGMALAMKELSNAIAAVEGE